MKLSPDQVDAVLRASRPLPPADRDAFITEVSRRCADHAGELGDGTVFRICRETQRSYWDPPSEKVCFGPRHHGER